MSDRKKIDIKGLFFAAIEQRNTASAKVVLYQHGMDRSVQNADGVSARQIAEAAEIYDMICVLHSAPTVMRGFVYMELDDGASRKVVPFRSRLVEL